MKAKVCSGCGACVAICPKKCISLEEDAQGFLCVSERGASCVDCGLCERVCPFITDLPRHTVARSGYYFSDEFSIRCSSSSGGACAVISSKCIEKDIPVVGAVYDVRSNSVHHVIAHGFRDIKALKGSKYLQSNPAAIYDAIDRGPCLVTGTPCQVAGARLYERARGLTGSNFYVDFYCHGVPSAYLWRRYLKDNGLRDVRCVSFRDKQKHGWQEYTLAILCKRSAWVSSYTYDGDFFYQAFFSNLCLNRVCYSSCPFRGVSSQADLRVGDAWGHDIAGDNAGTSIVLAFSDAGLFLLSMLESAGHFVPEDILVASSAQISEGITMPAHREEFIAALKDVSLGPDDLRGEFIKPELTRMRWRNRIGRLYEILKAGKKR